jgi:hypothetical protein
VNQYVRTTIGDGFDGPVDDGVERRITPPDVSAEAAAHALLRLLADHPARMGRMRAARIIAGRPVPEQQPVTSEDGSLERYSVSLSWPLREVVALVDAMIEGGLLVQSMGARPTLALTEAGFLALQALDGSVRTM